MMEWAAWLDKMKESYQKSCGENSECEINQVDLLEMAIGALTERVEALECGYIDAVRKLGQKPDGSI